MPANRVNLFMACGLLVGLLAACTSAGESVGESPGLRTSPAVVSPTRTPASAPTATRASMPIELTILHTNDNWGATEPCG